MHHSLESPGTQCQKNGLFSRHRSASFVLDSLQMSNFTCFRFQSEIVISFDNLDQNKSLTNRCTSFRSRDIIW